jgi:hypothetical protein
LLLSLAVLPLAAALADSALPAVPSAKVFPITFWAMHYWKQSPDYDKVIADEQYQLIKDCNFNLVMGGPLEKAQRYGLMCMSDAVAGPEFRELWWTPKEKVTEAQRQRLVAAITAVDKTSPALWGYHLCDEPGEVLYEKVGAIREIIKGVDPARPVFINIHPGSPVAKFIDVVHPDLTAYDHYPIFEDGAPVDGEIPPGFENSNFLNDLANHRKACLAAGIKYIATMLSDGHYVDYEADGVKYHRSYGHMTEARLRWQAWSALAYNAGGIGWFIYYTAGVKEYETAAIGPDWKPTKIYYWLQKLNREVGVVGGMLQGMTSVGVYESKPFYCWQRMGLDQLTEFDPNGFITGVSGGIVSVGEFKDAQGRRYLVIVNRNVDEPVKIVPHLAWEKIGGITLFDNARCRWEAQPRWVHGQAPLELSLRAGEGCLVCATAKGA